MQQEQFCSPPSLFSFTLHRRAWSRGTEKRGRSTTTKGKRQLVALLSTVASGLVL